MPPLELVSHLKMLLNSNCLQIILYGRLNILKYCLNNLAQTPFVQETARDSIKKTKQNKNKTTLLSDAAFSEAWALTLIPTMLFVS